MTDYSEKRKKYCRAVGVPLGRKISGHKCLLPIRTTFCLHLRSAPSSETAGATSLPWDSKECVTGFRSFTMVQFGSVPEVVMHLLTPMQIATCLERLRDLN